MKRGLLQRAIDLAVSAHRGAEDPPGEPYILHPMRVMLRFDDAKTMAVAIRDATTAGWRARRAGRIARRTHALASTPDAGLPQLS